MPSGDHHLPTMDPRIKAAILIARRFGSHEAWVCPAANERTQGGEGEEESSLRSAGHPGVFPTALERWTPISSVTSEPRRCGRG